MTFEEAVQPPQSPVEDPYDIDLSAALKDPVKPAQPKPAPAQGIWDTLWGVATNTAKAVERGAMGAANAASDGIAGTALTVSEKTGFYKIGRTPEERKAWMENYQKPIEDINPFRFSEETMGPKSQGAYATVEGVSQFVTGMLATSKYLKVLGVAAPATKVGTVAMGAAKGAAVDLTFFKGNAERLSTAVQGTMFENPISRMLASDANDTELEGRLKNVGEGFFMGATIDALVYGAKATRAALKGDAKAAAEFTEAAVKAKETIPENGVMVKPSESGSGFDVVQMENGKPTGSVATFPTEAQAETQAGAIEMVIKRWINPPKADLTAVDVNVWKQVNEAIVRDGDPRTAADILYQNGINPDYVQGPAEKAAVWKALAETHSEPIEGLRGLGRTWDETAADAAAFGFGKTKEEAMQNLASTFKTTEGLDAKLLFYRTLLQQYVDDAWKLSRAADVNPDDPDTALALSNSLNYLLEFHSNLTGTVSNVARALRQQAIEVGGEGGVGDVVAKAVNFNITEGLSGQEIRDMARSIFLAGGDASKVMKVLEGLGNLKIAKQMTTDPQNLRDFLMTWRMEAMLSGPKTHVGNVVSNAMVMMTRPIEHWWAGISTKNPALKQFGQDMISPIGLWGDLQDSLSAALQSFKSGSNVLEGTDPFGLGGLKDLSTVMEGDGKTIAGNALQVLFRLPSRLLMSSDEFFKQMNYRMNIRAQILRQAREEGVQDVTEIMRRLDEQTKFSFAPDGAAVNEKALEYAKVSTFTNDLGTGTIGQSIQDLAGKHPSVRIILPFIKTPVNIFRYAHERTPVLNRFSAEAKAALASGDPERIALTKAKAEVGALFWGFGAMLAMNKMITGGGPSDPALRQQLQQAGWQPYSIRIGDRYVSFRRGDPLFTSFSIVADLVEMQGEMSETDFVDGVSAAMASVAASVTSKSFMQGFSDFFDAVSSGKPYAMEQLVTNVAGSFIPNALRTVDPNPHVMETKGFIEEMKARVPGFSTQLEPRRNVFGEPVLRPPGLMNGVDNMFNPFTITGKIPNPNVFNELSKLGKAIPMPPETMKNGQVDLRDRALFDDRKRPDGQNQSPYDRWLELIGQTGLKEELTSLVQSQDYKDLPDELKLTMVGGIVKAAQDQTFGQVLEEYPQLQQALEMSDEMKGARMEKDSRSAIKSVMERYSKTFVKQKSRPNPAIP